MFDDIEEDVSYANNTDADTSLADIDASRLDNIDVDVNTAQIAINDNNVSSLFAANNLFRKTSDNFARSEAMINERPLRTEKTSEIERKEKEESDN